jgi:uncharacterized protein involved in exopolysaccharide biosynthesis
MRGICNGDAQPRYDEVTVILGASRQMEKARRFKNITPYDIPRLTLRDMLAPPFRHRMTVILTFCSIFLLAIVVAWGWANRYYEASMQVVVGQERLDSAVTAQPTAAVQDANKAVTTDDVDSEVALLSGRDMLREVAQTCGLADPHTSIWSRFDSRDAEGKKALALANATNSLAGSLKVATEKSSRIIDVRYGSTESPKTTACVLQTLGNLYLQKHLRLRRPAGTLDFFAQETEKYRRALDDSETKLVKFSEAEGSAAPEVVRGDLAQEVVAAQVSLQHTRQDIAAGRQRLANIKSQMAVTPQRSATTQASISANLLLDQLHSTLLTAQLKRTQLLLKYEASYPLVKETDTEIAQTEQAIATAEKSNYVNNTTDRDQTFEYLRQDLAKTQADLASAEAKEAALQSSIHSLQMQLVNLDAKAVQHTALLREAKANEENYLLYLTKREQERTSDALDDKRIANVAIAVPAEVPVIPAHSPFSIMFAGFWLALVASLGAGYLAELADPFFRTPSEVEKLLDVPILAAVPKRVA